MDYDVFDILDEYDPGPITNMDKQALEHYYKNLGERIRKAREQAGYTLAQLADKVGLTAAAVSNYEIGIRQIPVHILMQFSGFLNTPIHFFLGPHAEPSVSIRKTLIDTLERYTEAIYPRRLLELDKGQIRFVGWPGPLVPVPPDIVQDYDFAIRLKNEGVFNYYFIKLVRLQGQNKIKLGRSDTIVELKPEDWVLSKIADTPLVEIVEFKEVQPVTMEVSNCYGPQIVNVRGLVIARVERLVK